MTNENLIQVAPQPAQPNPATDNPEHEHALTGKIARLPKDLRDQLNRRLENGDPASEILPWLNELPVVKTILTRHFDGVPVSDKNLTTWRQGGHQRWLQKREPLAWLKELKEDATDISRTGQSSLAGAAATVVSARILQILQTISGKNLSADDLAKAAFAITTLLKAEQNNTRLQHEKTRICQKDHEILLKRDKHQRDVVATGLRLLGDARAKQIESSSAPYAEKVELLGQHMFPELWQPRSVPENGAPQPPKNSNLFTPIYP
jgi:hypothetical protein